VRRRIASVRQRRRASLRWRLRHENPSGLTRAQFLVALEAQRRALAAAGRAEVVPWPHQARRRRRPYVPMPVTIDQQAAALNAELIRANRGR
jgi:hypothetical protein